MPCPAGAAPLLGTPLTHDSLERARADVVQFIGVGPLIASLLVTIVAAVQAATGSPGGSPAMAPAPAAVGVGMLVSGGWAALRDGQVRSG